MPGEAVYFCMAANSVPFSPMPKQPGCVHFPLQHTAELGLQETIKLASPSLVLHSKAVAGAKASDERLQLLGFVVHP